MVESKRALHVALLAVAQTTASTLYGMYELFFAVNRGRTSSQKQRTGEPRVHPRVVAHNARAVAGANGVWIRPECKLAAVARPDILCIPGLFVPPGSRLHGIYPKEIAWIRECYAQGSVLATVCSGALLLAEAGLLERQREICLRGEGAPLALKYPSMGRHPQRTLVVCGEDARIIMADGEGAWQELALFLIARFVGEQEAVQVARSSLIDWHGAGPQSCAVLGCTPQREDAVIRASQVWLAEHYDQRHPVAAMVARSGLSERSFKRRFAQVTGMSPMAYLHTLRLEEAKQILETTRLSVDAVANEVGYAEASFFGRLFRRQLGLTPAQYRKRFGGLSGDLGEGED